MSTQGPVAGRAPAPTTEVDIRNIESRIGEAVVKRDLTALESLCDPNYTHINPLGVVMKLPDILTAFRNGEIDISEYRTTNLKICEFGNTAIVTGEATLKGTFKGATLTEPLCYSRTLVNDAGRWRIALTQFTPIKPT